MFTYISLCELDEYRFDKCLEIIIKKCSGQIIITGSLSDGDLYEKNMISVKSIGDSAFAYCSNLTSITISSLVTSIDNFAFSDCIKLTSAYFLGNAPTLQSYVFNRCASTFNAYYISGKTGFFNPWHGYPAKTFVLPSAPSGLTSSSKTDTPVNLSWSPVITIAPYILTPTNDDIIVTASSN